MKTKKTRPQNPFKKIAQRNLRQLLDGVNSDVLLKDLKKYNKKYDKDSLSQVISRSSLSTPSFLKYMLAAGVKEFTLTISEDELESVDEYKNFLSFLESKK